MSTQPFGYAAALEQFHPSDAVRFAALAEQHGFSGTMAADHFQPWVPAQGQSAFVWSVLTALGERTTGTFGPAVTPPGGRAHPAVIAQAAATLAAMYPGRFWLGLGAGEALNEHVVGGYWPETPARLNRMFEAIEMIDGLFAASAEGRDYKREGEWFTVESTRLWTFDERPPVLVATAGPVTAKRAGRLVDGLITVGAPPEKIQGLFDRFDAGRREAGRGPGQKVLQVHLSWAETDEEALANALTEWPNGGMRFPKSDIRSPADFAAMATMVREGDFAGRMTISADPDVHRAALQRYADLGFDRIHLHCVGRDQPRFLEVFGREVLPKVVR